MGCDAEDGSEETGSEEQVTLDAITSTIVEKPDLLATYPLMWDPLRGLDKPRITLQEVLESLTALERTAGRVGIAYRRRGVVESEVEESGAAGSTQGPVDPMVDLPAEVRILRAMIEVAMGVTVPGSVRVGGPGGRGPGAAAARGAYGMGSGVVVRF